MTEEKNQECECNCNDKTLENVIANCEANIHCLIGVLIDKGIITEEDLDKKFEELFGKEEENNEEE
jgi:hypothetical protein